MRVRGSQSATDVQLPGGQPGGKTAIWLSWSIHAAVAAAAAIVTGDNDVMRRAGS